MLEVLSLAVALKVCAEERKLVTALLDASIAAARILAVFVAASAPNRPFDDDAVLLGVKRLGVEFCVVELGKQLVDASWSVELLRVFFVMTLTAREIFPRDFACVEQAKKIIDSLIFL